MAGPTTQSGPDNSSQGHNIYLIIGTMIFLPPVGVYLLEGSCDWQVGINIISWFFFITPSYVHGFGLLAYKKLWPKYKPQVEDGIDNLQGHLQKVVDGGEDDPLKGTLDTAKEKVEDLKGAVGT